MPWWQEGMLPFRDARFFRPVRQFAREAYVFEVLPAANVPAEELMSCAAPSAINTPSGSPAAGIEPSS